MAFQLLGLESVQIGFHKRGNLPDRLLHAVEIIVKVALAGLTQQQEHLLRLAPLVAADEQHAQERDSAHGDHNDADRQQGDSCTQRVHPYLSFP